MCNVLQWWIFNISLIHKVVGDQTKKLIKSSVEHLRKQKSSTYQLVLKKSNRMTINPDKFKVIHCNKVPDWNSRYKGMQKLANGLVKAVVLQLLVLLLYYCIYWLLWTTPKYLKTLGYYTQRMHSDYANLKNLIKAGFKTSNSSYRCFQHFFLYKSTIMIRDNALWPSKVNSCKQRDTGINVRNWL